MRKCYYNIRVYYSENPQTCVLLRYLSRYITWLETSRERVISSSQNSPRGALLIVYEDKKALDDGPLTIVYRIRSYLICARSSLYFGTNTRAHKSTQPVLYLCQRESPSFRSYTFVTDPSAIVELNFAHGDVCRLILRVVLHVHAANAENGTGSLYMLVGSLSYTASNLLFFSTLYYNIHTE